MQGNGKILVVDDNCATRDGVCGHLETSGFEPIHAIDRETALVAACVHSPDAIVLDLDLPAEASFGVLDELRSSEAFESTPILAVSRRGPDTERALTGGADAILRGTIEWGHLEFELARLMRSAKTRSTLVATPC